MAKVEDGAPVNRSYQDTDGAIHMNGQGIYALEAANAVIQESSPTTGVAIEGLAGQITTDAGTLAAGGEESFIVTNTEVVPTDVVVVSMGLNTSGGTPVAVVSNVGAGVFTITVTNLHASAALNAALLINFVVHKGIVA